ncbi:hypothetical protein AAFF_G00063060 [Aldrovandia affinis]|uniref:Microtubule-associated protein 10 C-terminal domain-containing protein n=1 Tax=Aldrovandia affinis TaxID=143900 RepID=A0AAD7RZI4_9TELE|nr:hypothetical protein AAFF_G00063060 [Aldrovandia affinis]
MEALRVEDLQLEEEGRKEERDLPAETQSAAYPEEVLRRGRTVQQTQEALPLLGEALKPLPLLSALLAELSQLNGQPQQLPVSAAPDPAWLYQPAPDRPHAITPDTRPRPQNPRPCPSPMPRGRRSPIPQVKPGKLLVNPTCSLSTSPKELDKAKRQSPRPGKEAPKSSPKRKLVYGLTNTVRLRLRQTNPVVLREHERREQLRRSQSGLLKQASRKPHRPTATEAGHKLTSSHGVQALKRSANLDENVQTLVNSLDVDTPWTGTPPSQTRGEPGGGPRAGNNGNGGGFPPRPPYDLVSKITVKGNPELSQNQTVRVHIPSALSQYSHSDHSDGGRALSDASGPQPEPALENGSFSSLVQRSCSHSHRDTPDPGDYLDDFTSLEPTEGLSPDLPSSPELALGSTSERASGSGSPSQGSWRLGLPVPVKAGTSPQHSLKGTHIIRARTQASAISLSSFDSRCASASAGSVRSGHHRSGAVSGATRGTSVCEEAGGSGSQLSECFEHNLSARGSPEDLCLLPDDSESIPSPLTERPEEMRDELGSLGFSNKCHHISELVLNRLPGYTL